MPGVTAGALVALTVLLAGCGFEVAAGHALGTTYLIRANCVEPLPRERLEAELDRVARQMSTFEPDSELMAFNRSPVGEAVAVSPALAEVVGVAQQVAAQTEGAFDATVGPLVALWGFGAAAATAPPTEADIRAALATVGHARLRASDDPPELTKLAPVTLDLSAIAKGHGVDRLTAVLDDSGCRSYLVEIGGEIRVSGSSPSGGGWRLGVESPAGGGRMIPPPIVLRSGAVATSGRYRQFRRQGDARVSHIIDPRTGRPVAHGLVAVTVVAQTALLADAYATALLVLGDDAGSRFADRHGIAALFVVRIGDEYEASQSSAMDAYRPRG